MESLTVLYDSNCAVCRRARDWLLTQPTYVPMELVAAGSDLAKSKYGGVPWWGEELVVVDDGGRVWVGPAAFVTVLWATRRYRAWSMRLAGDRLAPLAERFFSMVSRRRHHWARFFGDPEPECTWCHN